MTVLLQGAAPHSLGYAWIASDGQWQFQAQGDEALRVADRGRVRLRD
jgi:hypothetical protein